MIDGFDKSKRQKNEHDCVNDTTKSLPCSGSKVNHRRLRAGHFDQVILNIKVLFNRNPKKQSGDLKVSHYAGRMLGLSGHSTWSYKMDVIYRR